MESTICSFDLKLNQDVARIIFCAIGEAYSFKTIHYVRPPEHLIRARNIIEWEWNKNVIQVWRHCVLNHIVYEGAIHNLPHMA